MVDGEKFQMTLIAARTDWTAISHECLEFQSLLIISPIDITLTSMRRIPFSGMNAMLGFVGLLVDVLIDQLFFSMGLVVSFLLNLMSHLVVSVMRSAFSDNLFRVVLIVRPVIRSFLFKVFVRHKNTASLQLAAVTRQAGDRQLGVIIA